MHKPPKDKHDQLFRDPELRYQNRINHCGCPIAVLVNSIGLASQVYFQAPVNLRTDSKSLGEVRAPLGGSGGMLPWKFLKNQMRLYAFSCILRDIK